MTMVLGQVVVIALLIRFCWSIIYWLQVLVPASSSIYKTQYQRPMLWRWSSSDCIRSYSASNLSKEFARSSFVTAKRSEIFSVKFNRKNYFSWQFQTHLYLKRKNLWAHIDGTAPRPIVSKESYDTTKLSEWKVDDAKIMTWILRSVDQQFILNLRPHRTAKGMWDYLKRIYNIDNATRKYQMDRLISRNINKETNLLKSTIPVIWSYGLNLRN